MTNYTFTKKPLKSLLLFHAFIILILLSHFSSAQNCSVNAGIGDSICINEQLFLEGDYTEPLQSGVDVIWSQVGGPAATIVDPLDLNSEVTNLIAGETYTFRISTTCEDGAFTFQDVTYTVLEASVANAGPDATYCPGAVATLSANSPGTNETGQWTGGGNGISIDDIDDPNSSLTISGGNSGSATLRWTISNTNGCNTFDEVVITNRGGISSVSAGADQELSYCYSSFQSTRLQGSYAGSGIDGQIGTWTIISGPNVPNISNPNANNTLVNNLIEGTYVFRWTVDGPCISGYDEVTITVPAPTADITDASAGADQVFCDISRTSAVLNGNSPLYINEDVQWVQTSGPSVTIVSPNSPVTQITGLSSPNSYSFQYTISNDSLGPDGCSSSDVVTVSYLPNPPTLSIDSDDPIINDCGESTATIDFTAGGSGTSQFRIVSGPASSGFSFPTGWTNAGSTPLTITGLTVSGTYVVEMRRITTTGISCSTQFDQISVVISESSVASNPGTAQILDCNIDTTTLIGNEPPGNLQGTWSEVSGPTKVVLTNKHLPRLFIENLQPNSVYVFRWLISGGPYCETQQQDVQVITASTNPSAVSAGDDQTVCSNTPVYLDAEPPTYVFERGTWSVTPSDGVTFSDINDPKAKVTGLNSFTTYTFEWTISNGCGSSSNSITVDVTGDEGPIEANAGPDQCLNSGTTTIQLAGNDPSPGTGKWFIVSGPGTATFADDTQYNTTVDVSADGNYQFEWVISSGVGCSPTRDTMQVTIDVPVTTADAGVDQEICGNEVTLTGNSPTFGTPTWTQISGNAGDTIQTPGNNSTLVTGLVAGVYVFQYEIRNGVCTSSDLVTVYVSDPPSTADAGNDIDLCGQSSTTMDAVAPADGSGLWTLISGPNTPNIANADSPTTSVSGLITGTYSLRWTISGGIFCPTSSDTAIINVVREADAGADQSYCEEITAVNLTGTTASSGTWTQVSGPNTSTITSTSGNTATASDLIPGVYEFEYEIAAIGCSTADTMTVTLYEPPSIANAGTDFSDCDAVIFSMDADTTSFSGTGTWSVLSGPSGGSFDNVNDPNATFNNPGYGVYVFQWTVANGDCSNADQVRFTNYQPPSTANAGPDQDVTCDTVVTMAANDPAVGVGEWSFISKSGDGPTPVITSPILYNTAITNLGPKSNGDSITYIFSWTVSNGSECPTNSDTVEVYVYETPTPADAGPDQELCEQSSVTLNAVPATTGSGNWTQVSPSVTTESITTPSDPNTTVTGLIAGETYVFEWTTETSFCSSSDQVTITNYQNPTTADVSTTPTSYCAIEPLQLIGNNPSVGTGEWTQTAGNPLSIVDPNNFQTTAVGAETGESYEFQWTISNGSCASSSANVTITVNDIPSQPLAGSDLEVCYPSTAATLSGNAPEGTSSAEWVVISAPSGSSHTFDFITSPTATISNLSVGTYELQWRHYIGSCEKTDNMFITVYGETTTANAGTDQEFCNVSSTTLEGNAPNTAEGESGQWVRISGPNNPTIVDPTDPATTVNGLVTGIYVFRWKISSGNCPTTSEDFVTVTNNPDASAGPDQTGSATCGLTTVTLSGNNPYPGTGQWTIESGTGGSLADATTYNSSFSGTSGETYTLRWTLTGADGSTCTSFDEMTVTFNEEPTVDPILNQELCNTDNTTAVNFTGSMSGSGDVNNIVYRWTNTDSSIGLASSGTGNIASFKALNTGTVPVVATITVTPEFDNSGVICYGGEETFTITVNPTPSVTSATTKTICNGDDTDYTITSDVTGTTFTWTAALQSGTASGFSNGSGSLLDQTLTNSTTSPAVVRYTITPTGPAPTNCVGSDFTLDVTVNPTPDVIASDKTICSSNQVGVALSSNVSGTTFYYDAPVISGDPGNITGGTARTSPGSTDPINDVLVNTTATDQTATYTVYPIYDGCVGSSLDVTVTVQPEPVASDGSIVVCSGQTLDFSLLNQVTSLQSGATFTYTVSSGDEANVPAASDRTVASDANLTDTYTNNTNSPVDVTYSVTPIAANGCFGQEFDITVTVNPEPQVDNPGDQVYCNNSSITLNFSTQNTDGTTTYSWTNDNTNIGLAASGNGDLSFTAANSGTSPISATIEVTPSFENGGTSCTGNPQTFTITVNPTAQVNSISNQELCDGEATNPINFTTINSGGTTTYSWTIDESIGLSPQSGSGDIGSFTAINSGVDSIIATVEVVPQFENGGTTCNGPSESFTVTVYPTPVVSSESEVIVCSGETLDYEITSETPGTTFNWTATNNVGTVTGFSSSGTSSTISDELTNAGDADGKVTYTITPEANGCPGPEFKLEVTVLNCNPKIGVAKQLVSTSYNEDGTADILFNIRVQNYGNVVLDSIQVVEDLATAFSGNYEVLELSSTSFDVNTSFNGDSDQNLLNNAGTSNILAVGASTDIQLKVKVLSPGNYINQVTASSPSSGGTTDDSQDGSDPDDGSSTPSENGDEEPGNNNEPTPVVIGDCTLGSSVTQSVTCGAATGAVTLTSSAAGTITLAGSSQTVSTSPFEATFSNLNAGNYEAAFVAASNGCIVTENFDILNSNSDLVASITAHQDVSCHNGNDGEIEVTATGGTGTYVYNLIDAGDTISSNSTGAFDTLEMGEYSVRVEDTNGCTYTVSFDIEEPTELIAEIVSSTDVSCNGGADGSATVNVTGGTTPYTYAWNDGSSQTTATATGLAAGTYQVTVTDANGCTTTASVTIEEPTALSASTNVVANVLCYGESTGVASVTPAGGTSPYSYIWETGSTDSIATGLSAGNYDVRVIDANGCEATSNVTIDEPASAVSAVINTADVTQPSCEGNIDGEATVTASGGTSPYTYLWSDGQTDATATGLTAGNYTVTVTDDNGCTAEASVLLSDPTGITATITAVTHNDCYNGTIGTATVTATGGDEAYSYLWDDGEAQITATASDLAAGFYTVTVTDGNNCQATAFVEITAPDSLFAEIVSSTDVSCNSGTDGTATVNVTGGTTPYTYAWNDGSSQTTATATGLAAGTYQVTVTDANDCTTIASVTIEGPTALSANTNVVANVLCYGESTGVASVTPAGGTSPYSYIWETGSTDSIATGLSEGSYDVRVIDANGCEATSNVTISQPTTAVAATITSSTNPSCEGGTTGSATVEGNGGTISTDYTYLWSDGQTTATATGLTAGYYEVTVTDANGCSATTSVLLSDPTGITATITAVTQNDCYNGTSGSATVTADGGSGSYSYLWSNGQTTATASNLAEGTYTVTVDDGSCTAQAFVEITAPDSLFAEIVSSTDVSCNSGTDGTATVNVTGGTIPYTYAWNDGSSQTTATATGLAAGTYQVTVTDANDCTTIASVTIDEPENPLEISSATPNDPTCYDAADGSVEITVNGGTTPYSFVWSNGQASQNATGLTEGTYSVTVTDSLGCTVSGGPYNLVSPDSYTVSAGKDSAICSSETITLEGTSSVDVQWTTSGTGTFDDATLLNAEYTPSEADIADGQVQLTLTTDVEGSCDNVSDQMVLTIWKQPTAYAGIDAVSATGEPYQVLDAEAANYSNLNWTHDGLGILSGATTLSPVYTPGDGETGIISLILEALPESGDVCSGAKDTMTISIGEEPGISVEKRTVQVVLNDDGSTDITFEFNIENIGNVDLSNISIIDDLATTFPGSCNTTVLSLTSDNFNVNESFDGIFDTQILTTGNTLEVLAKKAVLLSVRIVGCDASQTSFTNEAIVQGTSAGNETVTDKDSSSVSIEEDPVIGLAKQLVNTVSNGDGTYSLTFNIRVSNYGTVSLHDIVVEDDLDDVFGTGNYVVETITSEYFAVNENYTGGADENLLAENNYLEPSETGAIQLNITVLSAGSYSNQAEASGISPIGTEVSDSSQSGTDPDPDADGDPTNNNETTDIELGECISTLTCPDPASYTKQVTPNECGYKVVGDEFDATTAGDCELVSLTHDYELWNSSTLAGATLPVGTTTITWTAEFASGTTLDCEITITVEDNEAPEFVNCPQGDTLTIGLFSNNCQGSTVWSIPVATDNCDGLTTVQTSGPESGTLLDPGFYTIEYTATDVAGNSSVCQFTLEVTDTEAPVVVCPSDIYQNANKGSCGWTSPTGSLTPLLALSNCPFDISYQISGATNNSGNGDASGTTFNLGESEVIYTITETASGQSWNCSFTVHVSDDQAPVFDCPDKLIVNNDQGDCYNLIELEVPENTDCDETVTVKYKVYGPDNSINGPFKASENSFEFGIGISQVEWIMEDNAGNISTCMQQVVVNENENPVINCPLNDHFVFSSESDKCGFRIPDARMDATANDNCSGVELSHNYGDWAIPNSLEGATFPVGTTEVIWTATDASGNTSSCKIEVTVNDNEAPEFVSCPSGTTFTVGLFSGACEGGAIWSIPVAVDNCSGVSVEQTQGPAQGSILEPGIYPIQYQATDASGNTAYCSFAVKVTDTEDPVIVCQPDMTRETNTENCTWISPAQSLSPLLANSNCPAEVIWEVKNPDGTMVSGEDDVSGYSFELGESEVFYSITENSSGQTWDCSFKVTVIDGTPPVISCNPSIEIIANPGDCSALVNLSSPEVNDNCSASNVSVQYRVFNADNTISSFYDTTSLTYEFQNGVNRIEWIVEDNYGNSSFCWQDVWISIDPDTLKPFAGENASICQEDSFELHEATAPSFAKTVEWTSSGSGYFVNPSEINTTYVPSPGDILDGVVVLTIHSSSECATATDQMLLTINESIVVRAGNDAEICESDTYQLNGSILSSVSGVNWYSLGSGTFNDNTLYNPVYTPGVSDIENGSVNIVFEGISSGSCLNATDTMVLHINKQPVISAGSNLNICGLEEVELSGSSITHAETVSWTTSGTGEFNNDKLLHPVYTPSQADVINGSVILTIHHQPNGVCQSVSDAIVLAISGNPTGNAGNNSTACFGESILIAEATAQNFSLLSWTSTGDGTIENPNTISPTYVPTDNETGKILMELTIVGQYACITDTVFDEVEIEILEPLVANAMNDDTVFYNSSALLSVNVENGSGTYFYSWQPEALVLDPNANYTETVDLTSDVDFEVTVRDAETGCEASDFVVVFVEEETDKLVGFYNAFTPNNDGVNDSWFIEGIEKFPNNEIMIFNRWGDKIIELRNYDNKNIVWDGTNQRGEKVPDGTYYYIVTLNEDNSYTGWIHLRSER